MSESTTAANSDLASVPEVAVARRWNYQRAYSAVLKGTFGPPVRLDGRLFVSRQAVEAEPAR